MIIGSCIIMIGNTILYFSESIWITYLAMLIFGLGFGFAVSIKYKILDFCSNKKCLLLLSFKKRSDFWPCYFNRKFRGSCL